MTSKDTTGDKLVASIRKTKTGTTPAAGSTVKKKVVAKKATPKSAKKAAAPKPATPKAAPKTSTENTNANRKKELVNIFHTGRRVWPD